MIKKMRHTTFFLFGAILTLLFAKQNAGAETVISDTAQHLSTEDVYDVQNDCDTILERYNTSVYVILSKGNMTTDKYDTYIDKLTKNPDTPKDLILLYIAGKKGNVFVNISAFGTAQTQFTAKRQERIISKITNDVKNENYMSALNYFTDKTADYLDTKPVLDGFLYQSPVQLLLCIIFSSLLSYWLLFIRNKGNTPTLSTYLVENRSNSQNEEPILHSTSENRRPCGWNSIKYSIMERLAKIQDKFKKKSS